MVSVTRVDTTGDLRYAKVYISVLDKTQEKDVLKGLKSASGFCVGSWAAVFSFAILRSFSLSPMTLSPTARIF